MRVEHGISVPDLDLNKVLLHTNRDLSIPIMFHIEEF